MINTPIDNHSHYETEAREAIELLKSRNRVVVLTGAGISLSSGIPTYRDIHGSWQGRQPIQHHEFINQHRVRQRYWLRSFFGWPVVATATPTLSHEALASFEKTGRLQLLVTQNVDRLHQRAGSHTVIDLHGRLDEVICIACGAIYSRRLIQEKLMSLNGFLESLIPSTHNTVAPDGDANASEAMLEKMTLPCCEHCDGVLKPNVVFFGDSVPQQTVQQIYAALNDSDCLLVLGSSLKVFSGYRFCRYAHGRRVPIILVNPGASRADELCITHAKLESDHFLPRLIETLTNSLTNVAPGGI